jgi:AraC family transcriptional regulator of adaptative response / DNA-3-methyladenine glycosylase II
VRRFNDAFRSTYGRAPRELRRRRRHDAEAASGGAVVLRLAYRPPYDWAHVRDFLATRAVPGVERVDERGYARTSASKEGDVLVCVRPLEAERALELRVRGAAPASLFHLSSTARRTFDLAADPARIASAFAADPLLGPLARRWPGLRIPGAWDPFECAVRAVLGQQVSVAAGRTLAARVVARAGRSIASGIDGLTHVFPSAAELATANLDGLGMTVSRAGALHALARAVVEGTLDFSAPAESVMTALAALPGIGPWTAQYIALRALGDPDAFPAADLVLRRVAGGAGAPLSARALDARAAAWQPWRGYAVIHLWRAAMDGGRIRSRTSASTYGRRRSC